MYKARLLGLFGHLIQFHIKFQRTSLLQCFFKVNSKSTGLNELLTIRKQIKAAVRQNILKNH